MEKPSPKLIGDAAELVVAEWLDQRGIVILARNLRLGMLELDIVAKDDRVIIVVEVRTRSPTSWTSSFSSIDRKKRARLRRAGARLWNRRYRNDPSIDRLRYDVASVTQVNGKPHVEYVKAAF